MDMDNDLLNSKGPKSKRPVENHRKGESQRLFPSTELIVLLYSLGALVGLCFAFSGNLGPLQTTNCLLLSWILALGALAMSVLGEPSEQTEEDFDEFY